MAAPHRSQQRREPFDLATVLRCVDAATDALSVAREEIDALNVFPVADADTGTNMYLTLAAGRERLRACVARSASPSLGEAMVEFAQGVLWGARGNSGVITSRMLMSLVASLGAARPGEDPAQVTARALGDAARDGYLAVSDPVDGTMLSVMAAAAEGASAAALLPRARTRDVFGAASAAARAALERTPDQLAVLADAGVVDAGGLGVCVLLEAAERVFTGKAPVTTQVRGPRPRPVSSRRVGPQQFEVMYAVSASPDDVESLRTALNEVGDSVAVVGDAGLWKVHVHTVDAGAAVECGLRTGAVSAIQISPLAEAAPSRGLVAVAAGPGLRALFEQAGATTLDAGPGTRPTTQEFLDAIVGTHAREVLILPNDPDSLRSAEAAARLAEADHAVTAAALPITSQVQGLAAAAVFAPELSFTANAVEMAATARHARHGAVTVSTQAAITMAGPVQPGDVLGIIDGDFALIGAELEVVAREVVERLLAAGGELVTLVGGDAPGSDALAQSIADYVAVQHSYVDAVVYDGGQQRYPLLISVE